MGLPDCLSFFLAEPGKIDNPLAGKGALRGLGFGGVAFSGEVFKEEG